MDLSFELQNRARLIASLDPLSADVWQAGVGGPEPDLDRMETAYPDSVFSTIDESLDQMLRQSELQLESYSEVISVLEKEQKIREQHAVDPSRSRGDSSRAVSGGEWIRFSARSSITRGSTIARGWGAPS